MLSVAILTAMSDYTDACLQEGMKRPQIINFVLRPVFVALLGHDVSAKPAIPTDIREASLE